MKRLALPHIPDRRPLAAGAVTLWIAISPWLWGFADSHPAVANHVAIVFAFGPLALLIANLRPAAIVTLLGGIWLAISPWLLGYATNHAAWLNELVTGLLLIVLCASAAGLPISRPRRARLTRRKSAAPAIAKTADSRG
jgi:SPW repeat-containing protein